MNICFIYKLFKNDFIGIYHSITDKEYREYLVNLQRVDLETLYTEYKKVTNLKSETLLKIDHIIKEEKSLKIIKKREQSSQHVNGEKIKEKEVISELNQKKEELPIVENIFAARARKHNMTVKEYRKHLKALRKQDPVYIEKKQRNFLNNNVSRPEREIEKQDEEQIQDFPKFVKALNPFYSEDQTHTALTFENDVSKKDLFFLDGKAYEMKDVYEAFDQVYDFEILKEKEDFDSREEKAFKEFKLARRRELSGEKLTKLEVNKYNKLEKFFDEDSDPDEYHLLSFI